MKEKLLAAMADLDEQTTLALVKELLQNGYTPLDIVEICRQGVELVGKSYSEGDYFLADLVMSEEIFKGVMQILEPLIPLDVQQSGVPIVMGTIEGDIHDLGKNIAIYLLRSHGFRVLDLGVDVSPAQFVESVNACGAPILGISVLLSFCVGTVKKVVDLFQEVGLRDKVKIIVGGYPVDEQVKEYTGVDYYTRDVAQALAICRLILNDQRPHN
ncbi:MAG: cobalamin-dependent protein [Peptococcaceae bacterium]|nr:cobalamin-dependent protein [Peptococcaceae bacterium]